MAKTYKVLSLLLSYPTQEIKDSASALAAAIEEEKLVPERERRGLYRLILELDERDLYDLQERYVLLFDRTRSLSLHLFEHVHGESRDRGQALVDLARHYEEKGFVIDAKELPDYLPLFLEFLSQLPDDEAAALLAQPLNILTVLDERLLKRESPYTAVFRTLRVIARGAADADELANLRERPDDDPADLDALDEAWEDKPVSFGGGDGDAGCIKDEIVRRMAARGRRPAGGEARHAGGDD